MLINLKNASSKVMLTDYLDQYYELKDKKFVLKPYINIYNFIVFFPNSEFIVIKDNTVFPTFVMEKVNIRFYERHLMTYHNKITKAPSPPPVGLAIVLSARDIIHLLDKRRNVFFENPSASWKKLVFKNEIKNILSNKHVFTDPFKAVEKLFEDATHFPHEQYSIIERTWCQKKFLEYSRKGTYGNKKEYVEV